MNLIYSAAEQRDVFANEEFYWDNTKWTELILQRS